jgi:hypothetical protein
LEEKLMTSTTLLETDRAWPSDGVTLVRERKRGVRLWRRERMRER